MPFHVGFSLRSLLVLAAAAWAGPASAQSATSDSVVFTLSPASRFDVKTGNAGLFSFAGHGHLIRAKGFSGRIVYSPSAPAESHAEIVVATGGLEVLTPPDTAEIRKVTATMRTQVLDVDQYPEIRFVSKRAAATGSGLHLVGDLTIVGRTREVQVEVQVEIRSDTLWATATFAVKQTDFGIRPYRGGPGGTVRVADRVTFDIAAVGIRETAP